MMHSSSMQGTVFQQSYSNGAEPGVVDALPLWRRPPRNSEGKLIHSSHPLDDAAGESTGTADTPPS